MAGLTRRNAETTDYEEALYARGCELLRASQNADISLA